MSDLLREGQVFDMDPPRWMLDRKTTSLWAICERQGYELLIAPIDRCCIPVRVMVSMFERAIDQGALRPVTLLPERKPD